MRIKINELPPLDGEYPIDFDFTMDEWRTVQTHGGVRPGDLDEAIEKGDTQLIVALVGIALTRAARAFTWDQLGRGKLDNFDILGDEEAADQSPPTQSSSEGDSAKPASSSASSNGLSDASPVTSPPSSSGSPGSDTPFTSDPVTSAS